MNLTEASSFQSILEYLKIVYGVLHAKGLRGVKLDPSMGITLKGLEYLEENSAMKKAAALIKGIKDTIPGL